MQLAQRTYKEFRDYLLQLDGAGIKNALSQLLDNGSIKEFGNLGRERDGYYADSVLAIFFHEKLLDLQEKIETACAELLSNLAALQQEKFFDGTLISKEYLRIHELCFLSASLFAAPALIPIADLAEKDFSVLPAHCQREIREWTTLALSQILGRNHRCANERYKKILERGLWEEISVFYLRVLILHWPEDRARLLQEASQKGLSFDEKKIDRWINEIRSRVPGFE